MPGSEKTNGTSSRRGNWIIPNPELSTVRRDRSIYKGSAQFKKALTEAGLAIQAEKNKKNLGPILGKRLKELEAEHAGGDDVARSAREANLADLKIMRAKEAEEEAKRLRAQLSSAGGKEIEVVDEDIIEQQKIPSSRIITSEEIPIVSGEISFEGKLKKRETNQNVISRHLYEAAKYSDIKAAEEARIAKEEDRIWDARKSRADEAEKAYAQAYREYDPKFTKDKDDELIIMTRPPRSLLSVFGLSKKIKELEELYVAMVKARKSAADSVENQRIQKNVADKVAKEGRIIFKDTAGLKPGAKEVLRWSNEAEERAAEIKRSKSDAEVDKI
jgi:hypothetical protein